MIYYFIFVVLIYNFSYAYEVSNFRDKIESSIVAFIYTIIQLSIAFIIQTIVERFLSYF